VSKDFQKSKYWLKVLENSDGLEDLITDLDRKLNTVLAK